MEPITGYTYDNSHVGEQNRSTQNNVIPQTPQISPELRTPILSTKPEEVKKSAFRRIGEAIISGDPKAAKNTVGNILAKTTKDALMSAAISGLQNLIYRPGQQQTPPFVGYNNGQPQQPGYYYTNYNAISNQSYNPQYQQPQYAHVNTNPLAGIMNIRLHNNFEAEALRNRWNLVFSEGGVVSVLLYKEWLGIKGDYTDSNIGWVDPNSISIRQDMNCDWIVSLANPVNLNRA